MRPISIDHHDKSHHSHHKMPVRVGLLLSNLGSPDSPQVEDVRKYLKQFLSDPYVIDLPAFFRKILVDGIILNTRPKQSAEAYAKIWTKDGSPLLIHTRAVTIKTKKASTCPVEFGMRYGSPSIENGVRKLIDTGVNHIVFFPLYPQYSFAASESAITEFESVLKKFEGRITGSVIEDFYEHPAFINAVAHTLKSAWETHRPDMLLLSYHGIPQKQIAKTRNKKDYQAHCLHTSALLRAQLGLSEEQLQSSFQSRLGPTEWIKPFTDKVLVDLPKQGVKKLLVASPSFTADCLETLEEIEMRYSELFLENGGEEFNYVPCLNSNDSFVRAILEIAAPYIQNVTSRSQNP